MEITKVTQTHLFDLPIQKEICFTTDKNKVSEKMMNLKAPSMSGLARSLITSMAKRTSGPAPTRWRASQAWSDRERLPSSKAPASGKSGGNSRRRTIPTPPRTR